jgi:hypothetical protein
MQLAARRKWTANYKAAVGSAPGYRTYEKEWPLCACQRGAALPSRRHMACDCEAMATMRFDIQAPARCAEEGMFAKL